MIRETGIEARLILCTLRHFSESQSMETAKLVEDFRDSRVAALDIAGDEAGFPLAPHIPAFRYAAGRGLFRTAHAGEALGPESVWETLEHLAPTRIGHGTRSIEDPALVAPPPRPARFIWNSAHRRTCRSSPPSTTGPRIPSIVSIAPESR